ncbi:hypothetical protein K438DRAFT_1988609 [Mycena galopus ATCC 62051]|nr:hypothetical protein K438DRAFT_1988609 [Mycena galopus ATCC 62051]
MLLASTARSRARLDNAAHLRAASVRAELARPRQRTIARAATQLATACSRPASIRTRVSPANPSRCQCARRAFLRPRTASFGLDASPPRLPRMARACHPSRSPHLLAATGQPRASCRCCRHSVSPTGGSPPRVSALPATSGTEPGPPHTSAPSRAINGVSQMDTTARTTSKSQGGFSTRLLHGLPASAPGAQSTSGSLSHMGFLLFRWERRTHAATSLISLDALGPRCRNGEILSPGPQATHAGSTDAVRRERLKQPWYSSEC